MTFITPVDGQAAVAEHVAQLTEALSGVRAEAITLTGALTVQSKPVAVSPTAGNALTWDGTGLYAPAAPTGGAYVDESGDTMTGVLAFQGAAVDSGGAITVTSPAAVVTDRRVYGPTSAALSPTVGTSANEVGVRFSSTGALYLVAVRWYRHTGAAAPTDPKLWDSTSPATPVWSYTGVPPEWADAALGWKEHRIAAGTQPLLVAGRTYALSGAKVANTGRSVAYGAGAAPDSGIAFVAHVTGTVAGAYPPTTSTDSQLLDVALRTTLSAPDPAACGAVRLPNGTLGAVAWRNAGNTADLALTANASNQLTFNGLVVVTQAALDALTTRVATLEGQVANLLSDMAAHTHQAGTWDNLGGVANVP
jgi:outer membrane murein-binding lipoprotein Lpp